MYIFLVKIYKILHIFLLNIIKINAIVIFKEGEICMKKIGGVNMNAIAHLKGKLTKEKTPERYCSVYESLEESLKEVKLHRAGKIHLDTWEEYLEKKKQVKE